MLIKEYASESGHWYRPDGSTAYTTMGKNGKERPTTLRDARKEGYLPSVTTVLRMAAAPGLDLWKQKQAILSALTLPKEEGEAEADYLARILNDSKEQGRKAAEMGEKVHGALECAYLGEPFDRDFTLHVGGTMNKIREYFGEQHWSAEKSFAHTGYGGKVDLHSPNVVIDFKTKEFTSDKLPEAYDEHIMQLAAYRVGLGYSWARCANVFVSVSNPGLVHIAEHSEEDLERGYQMFTCLLDFWRLKNNYDC